jgi:trehalose-6-phosphate synthase
MSQITNISIRSPFQYEEGEIKKSQGGISTFLIDIMDNYGGKWICASPPNPDFENHTVGNYEINRIPISEGLYNGPYDDFYNNQIHSATHNLYNHSSLPAKSGSWKGYKDLNFKLGESAVKKSDNNRYFVNGTQLMMTPEYIRSRDSEASIVYHFHTTVPEKNQFKMIENNRQIANSLSKCDCVMVHTERFKQNLIRIFSDLGIEYGSVDIVVQPVPINTEKTQIDYKIDSQSDLKRIFSVDRMDIHKGIPLKMRGFELFLRQNPDKHGNIKLKQKLSVGRAQTLQQHKQAYETVKKLANRINNRYKTSEWTPVEITTEYMSIDELMMEYASADCFLITSLADGLNLAAFEYLLVSKNTDTNSYAIITETTGCTDIIQCAETVQTDSLAISESLNEFILTDEQHIISDDNIPRIDSFKSVLESKMR